MYNIDDQFLKEVGLEGMPENEKKAFLEHLQGELELRVGEKLVEGMSEEKVNEFEKIVDGDEETIGRFVGGVGDYKQDGLYKKVVEAGFADGSSETMKQYATVKWLTLNRPDFEQMIEGCVTELKEEVKNNRDKI